MTVETVTVEVDTGNEVEAVVAPPVIVVLPESSDSAELEELRAYKSAHETAEKATHEERITRAEEAAALALDLALAAPALEAEREEEGEEEEEEERSAPEAPSAPDEKPNREHGFYRGWK